MVQDVLNVDSACWRGFFHTFLHVITCTDRTITQSTQSQQLVPQDETPWDYPTPKQVVETSLEGSMTLPNKRPPSNACEGIIKCMFVNSVMNNVKS